MRKLLVHDTFGELMQGVDAFLLGRRTYVVHAEAFEPLPPGDPFGDLMGALRKYVVSLTLTKPIWRDTTIIRDNVAESVRALKAESGGTIVTDGSNLLVHELLAHDLVDELYLHGYPLTLGTRVSGKAGRHGSLPDPAGPWLSHPSPKLPQCISVTHPGEGTCRPTSVCPPGS